MQAVEGGFPDAITAVFPEATVQTCIVHLLRNSMNFVSWKDRKPLAAALKSIYRAVDAKVAEEALTAFEASEWTCNGLVPVTCLSLCHLSLESQGAYAAQI